MCSKGFVLAPDAAEDDVSHQQLKPIEETRPTLSYLVAARNQLLSISTQLSNQIRGLMKTFGLIILERTGRVFVREHESGWVWRPRC